MWLTNDDSMKIVGKISKKNGTPVTKTHDTHV